MIGIYYIKCLVNRRVYIGSSLNIEERINKHLSLLKHDKHVNSYLQNSYNKYGKSSFSIGVIDICKEDELLKREQFYIDKNKNLFNIVKQDVFRPSLDKETRIKISQTVRNNYKSGLIPKFNGGSIKKGTEPWNKGKRYNSTNHLKVPKKIRGSREKFSQTMLNKAPIIRVYKNNMLLGEWDSPAELRDDSCREDFPLCSEMVLRNPTGRNGYPPFILQAFNIIKSAKTGIPYKGLNFETVAKTSLNRVNSGNAEMPILSQAIQGCIEGATTNSIPEEL